MSETDLQRYARQFEQGFKHLRFKGALEKEFREVFYVRGLLRQRAAITLGVALLLALAPLDLQKLAPELHDTYLWSRIYTACPVMVLAFYLTFQLDNLKRYFQLAAFCILTYIGLATNTVVVMANVHQEVLPYEGINLIIMTSFLLAGLLLRYAIPCNVLIVLSYFATAHWFEAPVSAHQAFFIIGHLVVGATGCYVIEYNSRYNFLQQGMMSALAQTDALTGIYNRGAIDNKLARLFHYAQREKKPLCLMMVDIDYFKRYNDLYGHIEGDHCIYQVARALAACCRRPLDFAGRYGGEEFLLLWFDIAPEEAGTLRDSVQKHIADLHITHAGSEVSPEVTVSGGMVTGYPDSPGSLDRFLQSADDALYRAKSAGRNQIIVRPL